MVGLPFSAKDVFGPNAAFDLDVDRGAEWELLFAPASIIPLSMGLIFGSTSYFEIILF